MNVRVRVQLGLNGPRRLINPISLDMSSVGVASSWAGSYHILAMDRHFDDYVVSDRTINFKPIVGFPAAHPYERLTGKIRAAGVTGNIGEAVAALFARRYLHAKIGDIAHIRPSRRRQSPDYLMRLGGLMPAAFAGVLPGDRTFVWPDWWPVESKARDTKARSDAARWNGLRQLLAYWVLLANFQPQVVGYGMVVVFTYRGRREIRASVFLPRNQPRLTDELQQKGEDVEESMLRNCLYAC
jgi:hypothetical protein